ncbi:MAG: bifunctional phosphoribosylaminoimidazolecarboxamide formyltransferase/IMP cyclohydrolase [Dehalococcoidia bacterium]|nr:bifunctional phosphoribosylaminoimidazolecarboxamide formyltransferase/IMP cyclohydrolase [Dehalococcoidia bacterium]
MIALISVYDKAGVRELALSLAELGFDIYSTGGTQRHLGEAGLPVHSISALTGFPEILDGRVKTLHPMVHGGILARRDRPGHMEELARSEIPPIDLVCVNLYPFVETVSKPDVTLDEALENIDIGGPTMLRAAAKNFPAVLVLVDPADYEETLDRLRTEDVPLEFRRRLAEKAFQHVASYDTAVAQYLRADDQPFPERMTIALTKALDLRYGENPHQRAALYREDAAGETGIVAAEKLHGLELSYINVMDADAAWEAVQEFAGPAVVIVKHANPCGIATAGEIADAYQRAFDSDPVSPFGGIIAANRPVTEAMVAAMKGMRFDVIVAPDYEPAALERLRHRRDLRILRLEAGGAGAALDYRRVSGGMLIQEADRYPDGEMELRVTTKRAPTAKELADLRFAWKAVKHVKSNAVVIAKDGATVGIGGGQQNRKTPVELALRLAGERAKGAVLASDAFFPFARDDAVELACRAGVTAIIQPGGAVRDGEAIEVCDEYGAAMVFTGVRHFRH